MKGALVGDLLDVRVQICKTARHFGILELQEEMRAREAGQRARVQASGVDDAAGDCVGSVPNLINRDGHVLPSGYR